jgi:hypothetical protein
MFMNNPVAQRECEGATRWQRSVAGAPSPVPLITIFTLSISDNIK